MLFAVCYLVCAMEGIGDDGNRDIYFAIEINFSNREVFELETKLKNLS